LTRLLARTPAQRLDDVEARLKELRTSAKRLDDLMLSIEQEEAEQARRLARGRIRVQREAQADVQIQLGDRARRLAEAIREGCEFYLAEGKVQWRALSAAD
jgi:septal ring factor EnvC (AmiA/AmiB activator)